MGLAARYASASGMAGAQVKSLSRLDAGNVRTSPISLPAAKTGVGHSANNFFAAGRSARICGSARALDEAPKLPSATTRYFTLALINGFRSGSDREFARLVAGPLRKTIALASNW